MVDTIINKAQHVINTRWYKIDTAGTLYPYIARADWNSAFRMAVRMKETIDAKTLQIAVDKTVRRFPSMAVKLKTGLFWYYLEENNSRLIIRPEDGRLCRPFLQHENDGFLLRILYDRDTISAEFFHAVTDGTGGMIFLKTLTAEYLRELGVNIPFGDGILDIDAAPTAAEVVDAFQYVPDVGTPLNHESTKAYHFPGEKLEPGTLYGMSCEIHASALRQEASKFGVTITAYLAAVMLYAGYQAQTEENPRRHRPISVSVPINLRKRFGGSTLRNFSWFVNPKLDSNRTYTFKEIVSEVSEQLIDTTEIKALIADIAPNRNLQRKLGFRLIPLPLKSAAISTVYSFISDRPITTTISNLGVLELPEEMQEHIERFEFHLGEPYGNMTNVAVVTMGEQMILCFTSNQRSPVLPRKICGFLTDNNLPNIVFDEKEYR